MYTVRFTTKKEITRYDDKGVVVSVMRQDTEVVLHNLPGVTAQAYSGCDNFTMEKEFYDPSSQPRSSYRAPKERGEVSHATRPSRKVENSPVVAVESIEDAARSGNMAAAINHV